MVEDLIPKGGKIAEALRAVDIPESFFVAGKPLTFPRAGRAKVESDATARLSADERKRLETTVINFEEGATGFDEQLYRFYLRKLAFLTPRERRNLYLVKVKSFTALEFERNGNDEEGGNLLDVHIYVFMKKREEPSRFNPVMAVSAVVEPSMALTREQRVRTFLGCTSVDVLGLKFQVGPDFGNKHGFSENVGSFFGQDVASVSLEDLMLLVFVRGFLQKLNGGKAFQKQVPHIEKSSTFVTYQVTVPFGVTSADPLRVYSAGKDPSLFPLCSHLLQLLYPQRYQSLDARRFPPEVVAERDKEIRKLFTGDSTVYYSRWRAVGLHDYEAKSEGVNEVLGPKDPIDYDYNLPGPRSAASWTLLMGFLLCSEELLFLLYDQIVSARSAKESLIRQRKKIVEQAVEDFAEYYDINVIEHGSFYFQREYEVLKDVNLIDRDYSTLRDKLDLLRATVEEEQRREFRTSTYIAIGSLAVAIVLLLVSFLGR